MRFADLVAASTAVAATSSRTAKRDHLASLLRAMAPQEVAPAVGMLVGVVRQGRIGIGWATVRKVTSEPALEPSLTIRDVDRLMTEVAITTGPGSVGRRAELLGAAFDRATAPEQAHLGALIMGNLRHGAQEGVMVDAVAAAAEIPVAEVRRAAMLAGDLGAVAELALTGGREAIRGVGLSVLTALQPMLAASAEGVGEAMTGDEPVSVEWKLDGARIQVHRDGDDVAIFTRNLNDITHRLTEVVDTVRAYPANRFVLDGEILGILDDDDGTPNAFQDTMSRFGRDLDPAVTSIDAPWPGARLRPWFFDLLHLDGDDLVDAPYRERRELLDRTVGGYRIPGIVTADPAEAGAFLDATVAAGHEGVMVKDLDSPYAAGRRGKSWRKVKPVHVVDLVVLAAEWGHGRRQGWLSNLHLGARDATDPGRFHMVGKTFKGLTDALLTWQTAAFLEREIGRDDHVVHVRPDLVVEIALDSVQTSTRYESGIALRFARVRRYRPDKAPTDADTLDALLRLLPAAHR